MKRMVLIFALLFSVTAVESSAEPVKQSDFRLTVAVSGKYIPETPAKIPLTRKIISSSSEGFSDLRLYDDEGLETPYVVYRQYMPGQSSRSIGYKVVSYKEVGDGIEIVLQRVSHGDQTPLDMIDIHTSARDFKKTVTVSTSGDADSWEEVGSDAIFDFTSKIDLRKTQIELTGSTAQPYLRILLEDDTTTAPAGADIKLRYEGLDFSVKGTDQDSFRIDSVSGRGGKTVEARHLIDRANIAVIPSLDEDGNTVLDMGKLGLPLSELSIKVEAPYYYRTVEIWSSKDVIEENYRKMRSDSIYRIPSMNRSENRISFGKGRLGYVRVKLINKDNPPLKVNEINIGWERLNLFFFPAEGRKYSLYFEGEDARSPEYDLAMLIPADHEKLNSYLEWSVGEIKVNSDAILADVPQAKLEKLLFTLVVVIVVAILGFWLLTLMRKIPSDRQG